MTEPFLERIPTLSDAGLRQYAERPEGYKTEAVEAALAELARRGRDLPEGDLARVRQAIQARDALRRAALEPGPGAWLGATPGTRLARVRRITAGILAAGLGVATVLYLTAAPPAANPLGYEPEDTKRYLRQLEVLGGRANVVAAELQRWFEGLWQGRQRAFTVAWLTLFLAAAFWFLATRLAVGVETDSAPGKEAESGH